MRLCIRLGAGVTGLLDWLTAVAGWLGCRKRWVAWPCALPPPSTWPALVPTPRYPPPAAVVFNTDGREIPIVHRVVKVHERAANSSSVDILTKVGGGGDGGGGKGGGGACDRGL